jgi:hypothetical protein
MIGLQRSAPHSFLSSAGFGLLHFFLEQGDSPGLFFEQADATVGALKLANTGWTIKIPQMIINMQVTALIQDLR